MYNFKDFTLIYIYFFESNWIILKYALKNKRLSEKSVMHIEKSQCVYNIRVFIPVLILNIVKFTADLEKL